MTPRTPLEELAEVEREIAARRDGVVLFDAAGEDVVPLKGLLTAWAARLAAARGAMSKCEERVTWLENALLTYAGEMESEGYKTLANQMRQTTVQGP